MEAGACTCGLGLVRCGAFSEAVATLDWPIRLWVLWLTIAMVAAPLLLLIWRETRMTGLIVLASTVAVMVLMQVFFRQVGFVRLLGLPHLIVWGPLAVYLWLRLRGGIAARAPRAVLVVFLASILVSLAFDLADVIRYALGERASMAAGAR